MKIKRYQYEYIRNQKLSEALRTAFLITVLTPKHFAQRMQDFKRRSIAVFIYYNRFDTSEILKLLEATHLTPKLFCRDENRPGGGLTENIMKEPPTKNDYQRDPFGSP